MANIQAHAKQTAEQQRAFRALYGDGGFRSWQRVLAKAEPANRADILRNALVELFNLAAKAGVSQEEISDWAFGVGQSYNIGGDADGLHAIIVEAKGLTELSTAQPSPVSGTTSENGEPSHTPPRLQPLSLKDFLAQPIKARETLLDPILPQKGLAMLYGTRGTGKTMVTLGVAYALATGTSFLKWKAIKPRRVLLVDGEMPAAALQERLSWYAVATDADPGDNLKILCGDLIEIGGVGNIGDEKVQAELEPHLAGIDVLILDNLSTLTAVIRDNDAENWGPIQDFLLRLRRRNISVLIVHHAGKGGQQRGTSRREDVLDTVICLRRPSDYKPTEGARFEVHFEKGRGMTGDQLKPFEAKFEVRNDAAAWTTVEIEEAKRAEVLMLHDDGMSVRKIAEEVGIPKTTVHRILRNADTHCRFPPPWSVEDIGRADSALIHINAR